MTIASATRLTAQDADKMNKPRPRTEHRDIDSKKRGAIDRYLKKQCKSRKATSEKSSSVDSCDRKPAKNACDGKDTVNSKVNPTNTRKSRNAK